MNQNEKRAIEMWKAGEKPFFSHSICEELTCGYGEISYNGEFEFPLYPAEYYANEIERNRLEEILSDTKEILEKYTTLLI